MKGSLYWPKKKSTQQGAKKGDVVKNDERVKGVGGGSDLVTCLTTYTQGVEREEVGKGYMRLAERVTRPDHIQSELAPFDEEEER